MGHTAKPGRGTGKVAIIEIAATDHSPAVVAIEVVLDRGTLTISDQHGTLTDDVREKARELIDMIRGQQHGSNH